MFKWIALIVVALAIIVAGGLVALSLRGTRTHTTTVVAPVGTATTSLPYDAEENAFMGHVDTSDFTKSIGCLAIIGSQAACDCAYRHLRAQGHAASELAAVGSGVAIENQNHLPVNAPGWLTRETTICELGT